MDNLECKQQVPMNAKVALFYQCHSITSSTVVSQDGTLKARRCEKIRSILYSTMQMKHNRPIIQSLDPVPS